MTSSGFLLNAGTSMLQLQLSGCNLSEEVCAGLFSVVSSQSSSLTELDLSNNHLQDSGLKKLCPGLESPHCKLESLRLSGCLLTSDGCASLVSALSSNPSHLRELDLSYNHPGESAVKLLSAGLEDPRWRLDTLRVLLISQVTSTPDQKVLLTPVTSGRHVSDQLPVSVDDLLWMPHFTTHPNNTLTA
ncbi:ribonuclease inhibitor-like [Xenentodon cancila]